MINLSIKRQQNKQQGHASLVIDNMIKYINTDYLIDTVYHEFV